MGKNLKVLTEIRTDLALEAANDYFDNISRLRECLWMSIMIQKMIF